MDYYKASLSLQKETIGHRRYFHQNAEHGLHMPLAQSYVLSFLASLGIPASPCAGGVSAVIGQGKPVILLRADMDALPMAEESGLPFASVTGAAHTCGHDLHAGMLLTAAKLLKSNEALLHGRVRLMFQPAEELLSGASEMISQGILDDPKPDAAFAVHVGPSGNVGECWYNASSTMMLSCDMFRITVCGQGGHSALPHHTTDPLGAAVQICNALQHLRAYEIDPACTAVLTIGSLQSGTVCNVIPETAVLQGSIRTDDTSVRPYILRRIREIAECTAAAHRCHAKTDMLADNPPLRCNEALTAEMVQYLQQLPFTAFHEAVSVSGSDDFAQITARIPSAYLYLSAGFPEGQNAGSHHPAVRFNEDVLPIGSAALAYCADRWLAAHATDR